jgi:hypothetical protein
MAKSRIPKKEAKSRRIPKKEAAAIWALMDDPSRSATEIANIVGCNRTSLYAMEKFQAVWAIQNRFARTAAKEVARGVKVNKKEYSEFDAWDDQDKDSDE